MLDDRRRASGLQQFAFVLRLLLGMLSSRRSDIKYVLTVWMMVFGFIAAIVTEAISILHGGSLCH